MSTRVTMKTLSIVVVILAVLVAGYAVLKSAKPVTVTETMTITTTSTSTVRETTTIVSTVTLKEREASLVDALGRRVVVSGSVERVVSLAPSITEEVCLLGYCSRLVGVDQFSLDVKGVPSNVTIVGGFWDPSTEKIVSTRPDIVFACGGAPYHARIAEQLGSIGVRVFTLKCTRAVDMNDIYWDLRSIATILGDPSRAERVVEALEKELEWVAERVANKTRPKVALVVYMDEKSIWVAGGGTFQDYMISVAGGSNVFSNLHAWQMVGPEQLLAANPDYIIVTTMGNATSADRIAEIFNKTVLRELEAFKNGRVYVVYGEATNRINRPSPGVVDAIKLVAHILHPDAIPEPPASLKNSYTRLPATVLVPAIARTR